MKTLCLSDRIEMGEYGGLTLGTCLALYGRKSLLKILKYYDIPKGILKAYHFHKVGDDEPIEYEDSFMEEDYEMTPSIDVEEMNDNYEKWEGMWETSTTNDHYENEDEDYEDDLWEMEWRDGSYDDYMERECC